jgi:hypothetical protein
MNTSFSWRLSRSATLVLAAGLVSGAAFAAATGISSASTATPTTTAATATVTAVPGGWSGPGGAWSGPGGAWSGPGGAWSGPGGAWGGPGGPWDGAWAGPGGPWGGGAPDSSGRTEYFHVASTKAAGPGATYTTARTAAGCTTTMTAYIETINGLLTVSS